MTKACKKTIIVSLCLVMLFGVVGLGALTVSADNSTSGTCGEGLTWNYDANTQTLTISGVGEMDNYEYYTHTPWKELRESITSLIINNGVTSIGSNAFEYCFSLTMVKFSNDLTVIGEEAFNDCRKLSSIILPSGVTNIGKSAFSGCSGLTSITIPNSVTSIGGSAFYNCTGLKSITISDGVTSIGGNAFYCCSGLTSITIPDSVNSLGSGAFCGCQSLETVIISRNIKKIDNFVFSSCSALKNIAIPEGVEQIGWQTFIGCINLNNLVVPNSVTSIGDEAFGNVSNVIYHGQASGAPWGAKAINGYVEAPLVYEDSSKTKLCACFASAIGCITVPDNVNEIAKRAFFHSIGLVNITIPNSVVKIDKEAFSGETVVFYSGIAADSPWGAKAAYKFYENDLAFSTSEKAEIVYCNKTAESVIVPNSVTAIKEEAFNNCTSLATINLPAGITKIGVNAFNNTAYYNNASNWSDNMLYIGNYLIKGKTDLAGNKSVKSGTTCIADSALYGCNKIITLTVPNSVKYIGSYAFFDVPNVAYTGTATGSPWGAKCLNGYVDGNFVYKDSSKAKLAACSGLASGSVVIPASTDTIGDDAFNGCTALTDVYIPVNVTRIGTTAFSRTALTDVYYEGSTVDKLGISFGEGNSKINDATWHYNSKKTDMPVTTVYTLSYDANGGSGAPSKQTGSGYVTISNTKPTRSGYTFLGWATSKSATSAQYGAGSLINLDRNITLYAVWQKGNTPDNPDNPSTDIPEANIIKGNASNNQKTYNYKTTVTFTAVVPEGGSVQWYVDGKPAGTDKTLTVKDMKTDYTVKVVVTDKNGNKTMDEEQVTIKHGFFDILIWFFVHLFNPGAYDVKQ